MPTPRQKPSGEAMQEFLKRYVEAPSLVELAKSYGVRPSTVSEWARQEGVKREGKSEYTPPQPKVVAAPRINLMRPQKVKGKSKPQVQALLLSDMHIGRVTKSYNPDVGKIRLNKLYSSLTYLKSLHERQHPLEHLVIFDAGDDVNGEWVGRQMELSEYKYSVHEQIYDLWMPMMSDFLVSLLQVYRTIDYYGVTGNHGNTGNRIKSKSTNWDAFAQASLQNSLANYKEIKFHLQPDSWCQLVEVSGWRFLLTHGDVIKMHFVMPYYGMDRKGIRWVHEFGKVDGIVMGHFHSPALIEPFGTPIFTNGTFVTDDEWAIAVIGTSGKPSQLTWGIHPERPVSWFYRLEL